VCRLLSKELAYARLSEVREAVEAATFYDKIMPIWLPYMGFILILVSLAISAAFPLEHSGMHHYSMAGGSISFSLRVQLNALATLLLIIGAIIFLYTVYLWVKRRDDHFSRSHILFERIVELLEALQIGDPELAVVRSKVEEMREREHPRNPTLWTIVVLFISILWLYIAHFLTKDFEEHEERERTILSNLTRILERRGVHFTPPPKTIPKRNTVLYAIATVFTLGLFALYWMYTLTNDPNNHFITHRLYEKRLVEALERLIEKA
jgi:uncharacterized membrane protein